MFCFSNQMAFDDPTQNTRTDSHEPRIGMEFGHHEEAYQFYNEYALKIGFSVRKNNHYKSTKKRNDHFL
jgi:hypothetical protein